MTSYSKFATPMACTFLGLGWHSNLWVLKCHLAHVSSRGVPNLTCSRSSTWDLAYDSGFMRPFCKQNGISPSASGSALADPGGVGTNMGGGLKTIFTQNASIINLEPNPQNAHVSATRFQSLPFCYTIWFIWYDILNFLLITWAV